MAAHFSHTSRLNFWAQQCKQLLATKKLMLDKFREGLITKEEYHNWSKKLDHKVEAIDSASTSMVESSDDDSGEEKDELSSSSSML